ncbi:MAG: AAA family ATPase [Alistipes sp.]|nr:AAA family ATPase [Alistipes sp.]
MRLISCYIENFGKLHEYRYSFEDGLNIILEENGWGKSTFAAFVKAMFYGMDYTTKKSVTENERKRYLPWQGGNYGGYLVFSLKDRIYRIERFFGAKDKEDRYTLYDEETGRVSDDFGVRPGEEIFGIDAFAFERSTFFPQEGRDITINDSLTAKLSNLSNNSNDVENFQKALDRIDAKLKYYKKTGDRGKIAELEKQIGEINHDLSQFSNRTETFENLKNKRAELENKRVELFDELKSVRDEIKQSGEYEGLKARKSHYDLLVKNHLEAKSRLDAAKLFFESEEQFDRLAEKKEEYDNLARLEEKYRDESENLKELEYRKHNLETQFAAHKKTPVGSFILLLLGIVALGCGVVLWALTDMDVLFAVLCAGIGAILFLLGIITWILGGSKAGREYRGQMQEVDEEIDCARITVREYNLEREQVKKSLDNFVKDFQVEQPDNILKSLTEIDVKSKEYKKLTEITVSAKKELEDFENANEMDKIRAVQVPRHSLGELQKKETSLNNALMSVMEEKNGIARRMDALTNDDDDENDLIQNRECLELELKDCIRQYEILSMTREYLTTANDRFKTKYIQKMKDSFKEYVNLLNGAQMNNVSVDIDLNVTVEDYGEKHGLECYSTGYRDMLSLCTRFALVSAMFEGEQPCIILDDPFVNLDENRLDNAMRFLRGLGEANQLIYFTCHQSRA